MTLAWRILNRIEAASAGAIAVRAYAIVLQPVAARALLAPSSRPGIEVRSAAESGVLELIPNRPRAELKRRMQNGDVGFIAVDKTAYAGHLWISRKDFDETEAHCRFELPRSTNIAWDYDLHIDPRYRMGRAFTRLWDAAFAYLRSIGATATLSRIALANSQSLSSHRALHAREIGRTFFIRLFGLWIYSGTFAADRRLSFSRPFGIKLDIPMTSNASDLPT